MYKIFINKRRPIKSIFNSVLKRKLKKVYKKNKFYFKNNELKFLVKSSLNSNNIKIYGRNLFYKIVKPRFNVFKILLFKHNLSFLNNKKNTNIIYSTNKLWYEISYRKLLNFFIVNKNKLNAKNKI
jgi:hypothetical protein